jgi:bifunctional non-homologous end joining protein LigD
MARSAGGRQTLTVEGRQVPVSNLEKVLYPASGFTKAQVIDYYARIAPYLLPHLRDRPVTLKRYPDGVRGEHFYEKDAPSFTPEWVKTFPVPRRTGEADIRYILINDLPTLVWSANLANLEIHSFLHRVPDIGTPTFLVFDLDPGDGTDILTCAQVAFLIKELLDRLGLESFIKVSGSKGMQMAVPLNTRVSYAVTQPFARTVAQFLERQHPQLVVSEMAKHARSGKVFIDWSQNADFKTTVGVYSMRAKRDHPYISLPVTWDEVRKAIDRRDHKRLYFDPEPALARVTKLGDLWEPVLTLEQHLPDAFVSHLKGTRAAPESLDQYDAKRNFARTPEPAPTAVLRRSRQGGRRRFVIQKHHASHLHYDFRLEMHDVLKSWAVPKGVPYSLDDRRLAMATEDHPIGYLDFEGTIPAGQYGGGTVMVWDIGTYEIIEGNYYMGRLHLHLSGKKLKGEWTIERDRDKGSRNWIFRKAGKAMKPLTGKKDDESALTGRSMRQIEHARDAVWQSNRLPPDVESVPATDIEFVEPMMAKLVPELPEGEGWAYEIKLDGYRALAMRTEDRLRLVSRRNNPLNDRFSEIAVALEALEPGAIVDGEVVALDGSGMPSFNVLQNYSGEAPLLYYAFDLLAWRGKNVRNLPLVRRRELLRDSVLAAVRDPVRFSASLPASAGEVIEAARRQGLEGIVAKRTTSVYEPGKRSGAWVKFKVNKGQELVIGGYRPGKDYFDNLAVGYYNAGKLMFIAKIRNGFTPALKKQIASKFPKLETTRCPFANLPEPKTARRGEALTAEAMKNYRWLKPELVAHIEFTDWTDTDHLRHARFGGLRDDKHPRNVVREAPQF